jgi:thymidylate synthase ThyX
MIEAKIIKDSLAPSGIRLTTWVLTYPRMIHSEFMTHRVFSRNASSSRAIPVKKQIQEVIDNPFIPLAFTRNKRGMQGGEALDEQSHDKAVKAWLEGRDRAVEVAQKLADLEVHKQYANRVLEPYAHISVVVTATDFTNFFALRNHHMAQPEIQLLAQKMLTEYISSIPESLKDGQWHLPFVSSLEVKQAESSPNRDDAIYSLIVSSVARCARVSYKKHDGTDASPQEDLDLFNRLLGAYPKHSSPAEHQAMAVGDPSVVSGNFRGWIQYRKTIKNENITKMPVKIDGDFWS